LTVSRQLDLPFPQTTIEDPTQHQHHFFLATVSHLQSLKNQLFNSSIIDINLTQ